MRIWITRAIVLVFYSIPLHPTAIADLIPAAAFGKLPPVTSVSLSPDGNKIVMLRARDDTYHVFVTDLKSRKAKLVMAADPERFTFSWCRFANNTRVVCEIRSYGKIAAGPASVHNYKDVRAIFTRLMAVNADGSGMLQLVPLTKTTGAGERRVWNASSQSSIISWLPADENHILMQIARDDRVYPSVYKLNIKTNRLKRVKKFYPTVLRWIANDEGKLLAGFGYANQHPVAFSFKGRHLRKLNTKHLDAVVPPRPLGATADNKSLYVSANAGNNTQGIYRISLANAEILETIVLDPEYDIVNLILDRDTSVPIAAPYLAKSVNYHWFDSDLESGFIKLKQTFPGQPSTVIIESFSKDKNRSIYYTSGNGTSPAYYLYDRKEESLISIIALFKDLGKIIDLEATSYTARDGLRIPAYLALPDKSDKGPFPTIILPHGGPYYRDSDLFDYWVQFFLSRGYAVLKPNFRGSSGYGEQFLTAGFKEWGLKMQDDVIDGLDWMIDQGYTDPERVCLVGASYGGYVASVAAYKNADRFKCAVSFAGVANLDRLDQFWRSYYLGSRSADRLQTGKLRDVSSPIQNIDKISIPMLIVHGDVDRRVKVEQSREFVAALKKAGKDVTYIEQRNGNHHLSLEHHRVEFFEAMDEFLNKHLGRVQEI